MKKIFLGAVLSFLFSSTVFAQEKPSILEDYKIIVGMIEDIYQNLGDLKERQTKLENTFSKIRVVNRDGSSNSASNLQTQSIQLAETTREELLNNLR